MGCVFDRTCCQFLKTAKFFQNGNGDMKSIVTDIWSLTLREDKITRLYLLIVHKIFWCCIVKAVGIWLLLDMIGYCVCRCNGEKCNQFLFMLLLSFFLIYMKPIFLRTINECHWKIAENTIFVWEIRVFRALLWLIVWEIAVNLVQLKQVIGNQKRAKILQFYFQFRKKTTKTARAHSKITIRASEWQRPSGGLAAFEVYEATFKQRQWERFFQSK